MHALSGNVGLAKAEVMAERIRLINPECRVTVVDDFVTPENVAEYLGVGKLVSRNLAMTSSERASLIDAMSIASGRKRRLCAWCRRYKVPLVTTGGAGVVALVRLTQRRSRSYSRPPLGDDNMFHRTWRRPIQDPLAAKLRERLKSVPVWGGEKQQR
ncbi:ThiF family adenylyltransferase [Klebsiella pneumoniae]|uniref:ThiF family adenylyltransferase n=1 Tax=Klebsiella pneumoniae TaxID=573 RepID=UPI0039888162